MLVTPSCTRQLADHCPLTVYDGSKSKKVLKMQYKTLEQTITDMSLSLAEREKAGWST